MQSFKFTIKDSKEKCDAQWEKLQNFFSIYPDYFDPERVNKDIYLWALGFLQTRAFGWGLPSTMLVPLADCLNHDFKSKMSLSLLEKTLHKSMNKIYLYKHNFDKKPGDTDEDSVYIKTSSKIRINCAKLFREDEIADMPDEVIKHWRHEMPPKNSD